VRNPRWWLLLWERSAMSSSAGTRCIPLPERTPSPRKISAAGITCPGTQDSGRDKRWKSDRLNPRVTPGASTGRITAAGNPLLSIARPGPERGVISPARITLRYLRSLAISKRAPNYQNRHSSHPIGKDRAKDLCARHWSQTGSRFVRLSEALHIFSPPSTKFLPCIVH